MSVLKTFLTLSLLALCVSCATYYVSPFGNDNNSGTSTSSPVRTIAKGISKLGSSTGTLTLMTGVYTGSGNVGVYLGYGVSINAQPNVFVSCTNVNTAQAFSINSGSSYTYNFSNFTIEDCSNGVSMVSGGYYTKSVNFYSMVFKNNTVGINTYLANLYVANSNFTQGTFGIVQQSTPNGGITVVNSTFTQLSQNGIYAKYCTQDVQVVSSNFFNNSGSGVYASCNVVLTNVTASGNRALSGAAVYVNSSVSVTVSGSRFEYNTVSSAGGAIFLGTYSSVSLSNSTFTQNTAGKGGAIYSQGPLSATSVIFASNKAVVAGGAFFCNNGQNLLNGVTFTYNYAPAGSAFSCNNCIAFDTNVFFQGNSADCQIINQVVGDEE